MKRKWIAFLLVALAVSLISGCSRRRAQEDYTDVENGKLVFYYLNPEENGLVRQEKRVDLDVDPEKAVLQVLEELAMVDKDSGFKYTAVLDKQVRHQGVSIDEEEVCSINFGSGYSQMDPNREILVRAAIVKTISQLKGISYVTFYINDDPLTNEDGTPVGRMNANTFVLDNDRNEVYNYTENVSLYVSNMEGDGLVEVSVDLEARDNRSLEEAVLEALKLTYGKNTKSPIPQDLVFNRIHVIQNVCYVDLGEEIRQSVRGVEEEIKIYSMVNTLTSLSRITSVQFTVNGELVPTMNDVSGFDSPMTYDYSYVVESGD